MEWQKQDTACHMPKPMFSLTAVKKALFIGSKFNQEISLSIMSHNSQLHIV